jgi:hypothetical protein
MLELNAGIFGGEVPVGFGVVDVSVVLPSSDFVDEGLLVGNSRRAGPFPLRISFSSCWRSSMLNLTTYFFTDISFLAMILSIVRIIAKENHVQSKSPSPFQIG